MPLSELPNMQQVFENRLEACERAGDVVVLHVEELDYIYILALNEYPLSGESMFSFVEVELVFNSTLVVIAGGV